MLEWRSVVDLPQPDLWVLVFRAKQPNVVRYEPYAVGNRNGDNWISASGHMIDNATHWAYLGRPLPPQNRKRMVFLSCL